MGEAVTALKEPRGFLRCLELLFSIIAVATLTNYSSHMAFEIKCKEQTIPARLVGTSFSYPFRLDRIPPVDLSADPPCGIHPAQRDGQLEVRFPGNFASDAQFFVFTGVMSLLYCLASLLLYTRLAHLYQDKRLPGLDFCLSALLGMFWLAGSAAWTSGLAGLKKAGDPDNWLHDSTPLCSLSTRSPPTYIYPKVLACTTLTRATYAAANISVLLGFLNCFLWSCNLWFLYKETTWFRGGRGGGQPEHRVEPQAGEEEGE